MKITLVGAAGGEVTGSCYIVETWHARILVEDDQRAALAKLIQQRYRLPSRLPKVGEVIEF